MKVLTLEGRGFDEITVGESRSFERTVDVADVEAFARLSGDYNPLHMDEVYARATPFGGRIVHGMLVASFFSALVGMLLPGRYCLYLSQSIAFKRPLTVGGSMTVTGTVVRKSPGAHTLSIETVVDDGSGVRLIEGMAQVRVLA